VDDVTMVRAAAAVLPSHVRCVCVERGCEPCGAVCLSLQDIAAHVAALCDACLRRRCVDAHPEVLRQAKQNSGDVCRAMWQLVFDVMVVAMGKVATVGRGAGPRASGTAPPPSRCRSEPFGGV
jgi:hypothetical protein